MKTELEKRIIVAEACGQIDICKCGSAKHHHFDTHVFTPMLDEDSLPKYDSIDSIRSAVMQQSEEFQKEFAWKLECTCVKLNFSKPNLYYVHKLTPSDWLDAFVETAEKTKTKTKT